ncbi:hypothetical protein BK816_07795 [Boudabousia tangfeifanii]|uniref:Uncharacterized protein n=1 Tax=Boudabousia tangfeifanii TaxID=1912795 RepID=A0A1D9MML2_9ACTO|nr:hypothetical protein BK816_07795 [Boudabousia tangfeifanii]
MAGPTQRVIQEIQAGGTLPAIAQRAGVPVHFAAAIMDHLQRAGKLDSAESLCSSGLGGCAPGGPQTDEAKIHCAGCPLTRS